MDVVLVTRILLVVGVMAIVVTYVLAILLVVKWMMEAKKE